MMILIKKLLFIFLLLFFACSDESTKPSHKGRKGCCSHHGGVDCSLGADVDGSVICSDGWKNSLCFHLRLCNSLENK